MTALITTLCSFVAKAADIYLSDDKHQIYLEGEIRRGDAEHIVATALESMDPTMPFQMFVSSNGGDISEAMKIVSLIKGAKWDVLVPQGKVCASSCFFMYIAGVERISGNGVNDDGTLLSEDFRKKYTFGVVGIHRPYFKDPSGNFESQQNQKKLMNDVKKYLVEEGVAQYLIDEMMSHPSNDIYWLRDRDLQGIGKYRPELEEILINKCGYIRYENLAKENRSTKSDLEIYRNCIFPLINQIGDKQRIQFFSKLRTGWRPWKK